MSRRLPVATFVFAGLFTGCSTLPPDSHLPTNAPAGATSSPPAPNVSTSSPLPSGAREVAAGTSTDSTWWATSWTTVDGGGFLGKPAQITVAPAETDTVLVRYSNYVSRYDGRFRAPQWAAYTLTTAAVAAEFTGKRTAKNPQFARPSVFFQEPQVLALATRLGLTAARHTDYSDAIDPRFPISYALAAAAAQTNPRIIQRGHMVPNNAMKCVGTEEEGRIAQRESFSLANVVPQMRSSNAPTWAALESACFDWARELGQVWMIVGPVFKDRAHVTLLQKRTTRKSADIAVPDALFYVVIGKRDGKTAAIGFILPHTPDVLDFKQYAVPVDEVEKETGLNFMPQAGEPNAIEATYQTNWLVTPKRPKPLADD